MKTMGVLRVEPDDEMTNEICRRFNEKLIFEPHSSSKFTFLSIVFELYDIMTTYYFVFDSIAILKYCFLMRDGMEVVERKLLRFQQILMAFYSI